MGFLKAELDDLKYLIAATVANRFSPGEIRAQIIHNLEKWKRMGSWVSAYDEWHALALRNDDAALLSVLTGRDELSVRLRQSPPYIGLLSDAEVQQLTVDADATSAGRSDCPFPGCALKIPHTHGGNFCPACGARIPPIVGEGTCSMCDPRIDGSKSTNAVAKNGSRGSDEI